MDGEELRDPSGGRVVGLGGEQGVSETLVVAGDDLADQQLVVEALVSAF